MVEITIEGINGSEPVSVLLFAEASERDENEQTAEDEFAEEFEGDDIE